jgi:hypothetical protein
MFILHKNNRINVCTEAARMCERLQKEAVQHARRVDHSWATIGELMGISTQAAQQRFGGEARDRAEHPYPARGAGRRRLDLRRRLAAVPLRQAPGPALTAFIWPGA